MKQILLACVLLAGCGNDPVVPQAAQTPVVERAVVDAALEVADVTTPAIRSQAVQIADTVPPPPPPTAREICNGLTWKHLDPLASDACFRAVTAERGWPQQRIEAWVWFVAHSPGNIIAGESAYCWNLRNGGTIDPYSNCVITRQGRGEDTGLGQATSAWWGDRGLICKHHGYCSPASILASPYDSMLASIVLLIEYDGSDPWCFRSPWNAYNYHQCWNAPDR